MSQVHTRPPVDPTCAKSHRDIVGLCPTSSLFYMKHQGTWLGQVLLRPFPVEMLELSALLHWSGQAWPSVMIFVVVWPLWGSVSSLVSGLHSLDKLETSIQFCSPVSKGRSSLKSCAISDAWPIMEQVTHPVSLNTICLEEHGFELCKPTSKWIFFFQ